MDAGHDPFWLVDQPEGNDRDPWPVLAAAHLRRQQTVSAFSNTGSKPPLLREPRRVRSSPSIGWV